MVEADQWLAGPAKPSRIEGISIAWPGKPDDLDIRYSVKTARAQAISGRVMELGSFAGTRGKGLPVVSVMIEISGPGASNFELVAEAIFLGAATMRITGKRVVAEGPTSREPLVGFRLRLQQLTAPQTIAPAAATIDAAAQFEPSSRVPKPGAAGSHGGPLAPGFEPGEIERADHRGRETTRSPASGRDGASLERGPSRGRIDGDRRHKRVCRVRASARCASFDNSRRAPSSVA